MWIGYLRYMFEWMYLLLTVKPNNSESHVFVLYSTTAVIGQCMTGNNESYRLAFTTATV